MPLRPPTHGADCRRQLEAMRGSASARGYNARWQRYRRIWLQQHPVCVACVAANRAPRSTVLEVDHKIPHRGDPDLFWDADNHQTLCKVCHSEKTAREDGGFGRTARNVQ